MAVTTGLLLLAQPAFALSKHTFSTSYGTEASGDRYPLSDPTDIAVDQSTGDFYVVDHGNFRVEKFDSSGHFILMFGEQVDKTKVELRKAQEAAGERSAVTHQEENLCTAASGDTCQIAPSAVEGFNLPPFSGHLPGDLAYPVSVAVDNSAGSSGGDVYVANDGEAGSNELVVYISKFDPSGRLIASWELDGQLFPFQRFRLGGPNGVAVDPGGNLFFSDGHNVAELGQAGGFLSTFNLKFERPGQLAATGSAGNLYYLQEGKVLEFTSAGADLGVITGPDFTGPATGLAVDSSDHQIYVADGGEAIRHYPAACDPFEGLCTPTDSFGVPEHGNAQGLAIDESTGVLYAADAANGRVDVFTPSPFLADPTATTATPGTSDESATLNGEVDSAEAGEVTACQFEYVDQTEFEAHRFSGAATAECKPNAHAENVNAAITGLTPETTYHYRLSATNANGTEVSHARTFTPHAVIGLTTEPPTEVSGQAATLNGSFHGDGTKVHYYFEWGTTTAYNNDAPAPPPGIELPSPSGDTPLSFELTELTPRTEYHYRVVAENESEEISRGEDQSFTTPPNPPLISGESVTEVHSATAVLHGQVNPGGGDTTYQFEYVTSEQFEEPGAKGGFAQAAVAPGPETNTDLGAGASFQSVVAQLHGLSPETTYHYRILATSVNGENTVEGPDRTFTTTSYIPLLNDSCSNAHVRQQTGSAQLLDCRAYELVSAANAGGYDVESDLVEGQIPYGSYPEAEGRVLYGVQDGGIPGTNHPTNRGIDPYLATRGTEGWSTEYVGIPSDATPSTAPFASTLLEADSTLDTFAFGGKGICLPCFADGSTGVPIHLSSGELIQGMAGSEDPGPSAEPAGYVAKHLSANGEHLIFGSKSQFEPDGNSNGEISIYDRNLKTEETHVVSKLPSEANIPCLGAGCASNPNAIAELAISNDGSHVLIGQLVAEKKGAEEREVTKYWHLFMRVGDSATVELTPGATEGVLFDGMTADGSKVFFSSEEHLTGEDPAHTGADIFMWEEGKPLTLISKGEGSSCDPVANSAHAHWNTIGSAEENCGVVAIGGGGGVSSTSGSIYYLSPEKPAGSEQGVQNAPNLYVAHSVDGYAPHYVTTLESALNAVRPAKLKYAFSHSFGSFAGATGLSVEPEHGDVFVLNSATNTVEKVDSSGNPVDFSGSAPYIEGNKITGTPTESFFEGYFGFSLPTQLAVDQSNGDLYVPDIHHNVVDKFNAAGEYQGQVQVPVPSGVAVDPANGNVYVTALEENRVEIFKSSDFGSPGQPAGSHLSVEELPTSVAVNSRGAAYVTYLFGGETEVYESGKPPHKLGTQSAESVAVDPSNEDVYVDEGSQIVRFDSSGKEIEKLDSGSFSGSIGVTIEPEGNLYATNSTGSEVAVFGALPAPDPTTDNPAVLDSVSEPESRHTADFQTTPNGSDAVFPSTLSLVPGEETARHTEIYRYDAPSEELLCASCVPTGAASEGDSSLASNGLSLTDDGRVFFTTSAALVNADTDNKKDAYEWEPKGIGTCGESSPAFSKVSGDCLALISAGTSPFDSGLLGVSSNGKEAYFFTRDSLVPQDKNGPTMKIYDAREGGGFPYLPPSVPCKASDECHGASSSPPPPLPIGSESGSPRQYEPELKSCKKGFVRKHGTCLKKPKPHKHKHHKRAAIHERGGRK